MSIGDIIKNLGCLFIITSCVTSPVAPDKLEHEQPLRRYVSLQFDFMLIFDEATNSIWRGFSDTGNAVSDVAVTKIPVNELGESETFPVCETESFKCFRYGAQYFQFPKSTEIPDSWRSGDSIFSVRFRRDDDQQFIIRQEPDNWPTGRWLYYVYEPSRGVTSFVGLLGTSDPVPIVYILVSPHGLLSGE